MADAVSCPATATTGTAPTPVSSAISFSSGPITTPGWTISSSTELSTPMRSSSGFSKLRVRWFIIPEVEASVYSHTFFPVSI